MKRLLCVLPLLLCLYGCVQEAPVTEPEPSPGLFDDTHSIQMQTGGAVKAYPLGDYDYRALAAIGQDYLLFGEDSLTLLSGENLTPVTTVPAPGVPLPSSGQIQINENGVCYYSSTEKTVVFLGRTLLEVGRLHLPEEITGTACLSPEWNKLYFCTAGSIQVLDLGSGTSQTLKTLSSGQSSITGILLGGAYLRCATQNANGTYTYSLISAETGQTLYEGEKYAHIRSLGQSYCFHMDLGPVQEFVFGQGRMAPQSLFFDQKEQVLPLLENNALLRLSESTEGVVLEYFQLSTGKRSGQITLPGVLAPEGVCGDGSSVWFQWDGTLYRWDPSMSPTGDETVYSALHYTRDNPDEDGFAALQKNLQQLEQTWGVQILCREEAAEVVPWDSYRFETEYVPQVYQRCLAELERAMSHFPQDFFAQAAQWTGNPLQIVLTRGIYGEPEQGTLSSASSIQYQLNGKAYLALSLWGDLERAFYHGVSHLIETRILSTCTAYYEWNTLNPQGFRYDNDYIANQSRQDEQYLQDSDRSFIDMYSMSFAIEDRARIMEYACLPGNEGYFISETMQEKLRRVCAGIREAFDLTGENYLWEQYLLR